MIAKFWKALFQYVDMIREERETYDQCEACYSCQKAKTRCHMTCKKYKAYLVTMLKRKRVETARDVEAILQMTYDDNTESEGEQ